MDGHRINTEPAFRARGWTAVCSCGWRSAEETSRGGALARGYQHNLDVDRLYALLRRGQVGGSPVARERMIRAKGSRLAAVAAVALAAAAGWQWRWLFDVGNRPVKGFEYGLAVATPLITFVALWFLVWAVSNENDDRLKVQEESARKRLDALQARRARLRQTDDANG